MNKEEKNAIEYYQNKEVSFSADFDTEKLLKALGITEEDSFQNHQIRFKTLLNLIEKLQKENEELKYKYNKALSDVIVGVDLDNTYISKQKVKDKIEEELPLIIVGGRKNKKTLEYGIKLGRRQVLQELIEERE